MCIFIRLISCRQYGLTVRSRTGLSLLILNLFNNGITDYLALNADSDISVYSCITLISVSMLIIYIVGLIMFINGSPADRSLKRFVRWIPFIDLIATVILSFASAFMDDMQIMYGIEGTLIRTSVSLLIFMNVYRLARRSVESGMSSCGPLQQLES